MEQFVQALYWVGYFGMSIALAITTIAIFIVGIKLFKDRKRGIGTAFIMFSILATGMIASMINMKFL